MEELVGYLLIGIGMGILAGAAIAWVLRGARANREIGVAEENWQRQVARAEMKARLANDQMLNLKAGLEEARTQLQENKHAVMSSGTELESAREKIQSLVKELAQAQAERDEYGRKFHEGQQFVIAAKKRVEELTAEFEKSRVFYKGQIGNAIERRHALERKVDDLGSEIESLTKLLAAAKSEHDAVSRMLASSRVRLENLDATEQKNIELEARNAELRHELEALQRSMAKLENRIQEFEDVKAQNRELARCLDSMEESRKQYEADARRYRDQYEQSEKESETLRMKLGDIEESLADMQAAHDRATEITCLPEFGVEPPPHGEGDDLTQIVGIGKVFEEMLHGLGIYYFRQIATFGPEELARVNAELKEFKGRIEHDDWIGQARELHFKKYGAKRSLATAG